MCQADGPPRSYPRSLRAEYAFRLVVSRLGWVTSPERGRPPSTASEIRYTSPAYNALGHPGAPKSDHPDRKVIKKYSNFHCPSSNSSNSSQLWI